MGSPFEEGRGTPKDPAFLAWLKTKGRSLEKSPWGTVEEWFDEWLYITREEAKAKAREEKARLRHEKALRGPAQIRLIRLTESHRGLSLERTIQEGWRFPDPDLWTDANQAVNNVVPLQKALSRQHWQSNAHRWTFTRHYLEILNEFGGYQISEAQLLVSVKTEEEAYQKKIHQGVQRVRRRHRPAKQRSDLIRWASQQHMNIESDFEPGIAYFSFDPGAMYVDYDIKEMRQEDGKLVVKYNNGRAIRIPTSYIDFGFSPFREVETIFLRRHRKSQRLVPFVQYVSGASVYRDLPPVNEIQLEDRWRIALPRIDRLMNPTMLSYYSEEAFRLRQMAGILKIMTVMAGGRVGSGMIIQGTKAFIAAYPLVTRVVAVPSAAVREIAITLQVQGVTIGAGRHLLNTASGWYYRHAAVANEAVVGVTEITLDLAGYEMGVSVSDAFTVAVPKAGAVEDVVEYLGVVKKVSGPKVVIGVRSVREVPVNSHTRAGLSRGSAVEGFATNPANPRQRMLDGAVDEGKAATNENALGHRLSGANTRAARPADTLPVDVPRAPQLAPVQKEGLTDFDYRTLPQEAREAIQNVGAVKVYKRYGKKLAHDPGTIAAIGGELKTIRRNRGQMSKKRAAGGEIIVLEKLHDSDKVVRIRMIPSGRGGKSPDYEILIDDELIQVEVVTATLAKRGQKTRPRADPEGIDITREERSRRELEHDTRTEFSTEKVYSLIRAKITKGQLTDGVIAVTISHKGSLETVLDAAQRETIQELITAAKGTIREVWVIYSRRGRRVVERIDGNPGDLSIADRF